MKSIQQEKLICTVKKDTLHQRRDIREICLGTITKHCGYNCKNHPEISFRYFKGTNNSNLRKRDKRATKINGNYQMNIVLNVFQKGQLTSPTTAEMRNLTQSMGVKLGFFFSGY